MRIKPVKSLAFLSLFFLLACGTPKIADYKQASVSVDSTLGDGGLESIISPYRESMEKEMNEVIGHASITLDKYAPESPLGNFAAEAAYKAGLVYGSAQQSIGLKAMNNSICLLNFGGLRAPINQGEVTIGNMYELMPFDNTLVLVKLSGTKMKELASYLFECEGQPVFNTILELSASSERMTIGDHDYRYDEEVIVVTTNYLAAGGDKMTFFKDPLGYWDTGVFLRDIFIEYVKEKKQLPAYSVSGKIKLTN
jgi:2',3'-cyclic-nucleotide 2'-phosphodiesterase (5'-nucleotidase family)